MFLLEEIGVEIAMIAAVIVAVLCLAYLTQLTIREQVYLRRLRRNRRSREHVGVSLARPEERRSAMPMVTARQDRTAVLRRKRV
jgi:hypothetical protein